MPQQKHLGHVAVVLCFSPRSTCVCSGPCFLPLSSPRPVSLSPACFVFLLFSPLSTCFVPAHLWCLFSFLRFSRRFSRSVAFVGFAAQGRRQGRHGGHGGAGRHGAGQTPAEARPLGVCELVAWQRHRGSPFPLKALVKKHRERPIWRVSSMDVYFSFFVLLYRDNSRTSSVGVCLLETKEFTNSRNHNQQM